jgi:hypothetical protein
MDLFKAIAELHADKEKLDRVIASLEELLHSKSGQAVPSGRSPRGRKSMSAKERLEVLDQFQLLAHKIRELAGGRNVDVTGVYFGPLLG